MELKQHITDERTGISYTLCGDYYLPDLKLPEEKAYDLGRFRQSNAPAFAEGPHGPADGPADRRTPFLSTAGKEIIINRGSSPIALPAKKPPISCGRWQKTTGRMNYPNSIFFVDYT
mgnify:CR=1 FL=1